MNCIGVVISIFIFMHSALADDTTKIVGGKMVFIEKVPYQVSLQTFSKQKKSYQHYCGGSIISECFIVTAAHCIAERKKEDITVVVGTADLEKGGERHYLQEYYVHTKYQALKGYDIGIIRLKKDLIFSEKINKIGISDEYVEGGVPCYLTGWGYTHPVRPPNFVPYWTLFNLKLYPNNLKIAELETISNNECQLYNPDMTLDTEICTFKWAKGACGGDSGGPLVDINCKQLIGIVSFGKELCGNKPDGYTRVSRFAHWINDKMIEMLNKDNKKD